MKVLVTGASGFTGGSLARFLARQGDAVRPGNGGSTMSFMDGHVKFLTAPTIMTELGMNPLAPYPGNPQFFDGASEPYCIGPKT